MKHKKGADNTQQEEDERTISVINNLFQGLSKGSRRDRVAAKFVENEFEKCDRLMELYNRYLTRVVAEQVLHANSVYGCTLRQRSGACAGSFSALCSWSKRLCMLSASGHAVTTHAICLTLCIVVALPAARQLEVSCSFFPCARIQSSHTR